MPCVQVPTVLERPILGAANHRFLQWDQDQLHRACRCVQKCVCVCCVRDTWHHKNIRWPSRETGALLPAVWRPSGRPRPAREAPAEASGENHRVCIWASQVLFLLLWCLMSLASRRRSERVLFSFSFASSGGGARAAAEGARRSQLPSRVHVLQWRVHRQQVGSSWLSKPNRKQKRIARWGFETTVLCTFFGG